MAAVQLYRQDDFTGGLNLRADQFKLAPNESPNMLNVEIDPRGGFFSRGAMRRINTTGILPNYLLTEDSYNLTDEFGNPITLEASSYWRPKSMFPHYTSAAHYLMLGTGYFNSVDGGVYYSTGSNFTKLTVDVKSERGPSFASWGNRLFFTTGKGYRVCEWDGTTVTQIDKAGSDNLAGSNITKFGNTTAHVPTAEHIVYHSGRLFVGNITNYTVTGGVATAVDSPNMIRWSDANNPTKWTETNYLEIFGNGDGVTALVSFAGVLLIFKRYAVYALSGDGSTDDPFVLKLVTNKVGAVGHEAVAVSERGVYFFSWPDGLFVFTGDGVIDLFEPVRPVILDNQVNAAESDNIFVSFVNRRVWVSMPYSKSGTVDRSTVCFVYDPSGNGFSHVGESYGVDDAFTANGAWVKHQVADGWALACGCMFTDVNGNIIKAMAHAARDYVLNVDITTNAFDNVTGTDLGFASFYRTRWLDGDNYSLKKMWRRPDFVLRQQTTERILDFRVYHDYEESDFGQKRQFDVTIPSSGGSTWGAGLTWGSSNWGTANEGSFVKSGQNLGLARAVQLEIVGPTGLTWGVNSMTLKFNPRRVKG